MDKIKDVRVFKMIAYVMQHAYIDLPNEVKSEYNLEGSQNFRRSLPIDFLNVEIPKYILIHNLDLEFHQFKNASFTGCLVCDKDHTFSFTFISELNINQRRKKGNIQQYLAGLLHELNSDVNAPRQLSMFDFPSSEQADLYFNRTFNFNFDTTEMKHWLIVHKIKDNRIQQLHAQLVNEHLTVSKSIDLIDFVVTGFPEEITELYPVSSRVTNNSTSTAQLISLKNVEITDGLNSIKKGKKNKEN